MGESGASLRPPLLHLSPPPNEPHCALCPTLHCTTAGQPKEEKGSEIWHFGDWTGEEEGKALARYAEPRVGWLEGGRKTYGALNTRGGALSYPVKKEGEKVEFGVTLPRSLPI